MTDLRFLAACAGLLGIGAALLWAGGKISVGRLDALDDAMTWEDDENLA